MTELKKYKYTTYALAVCVVFLAIALYISKNAKISDIYRSINMKVDGCRVALEDWKIKHPTGKALTNTEQAELRNTLEMCTAQLEASKSSI